MSETKKHLGMRQRGATPEEGAYSTATLQYLPTKLNKIIRITTHWGHKIQNTKKIEILKLKVHCDGTNGEITQSNQGASHRGAPNYEEKTEYVHAILPTRYQPQ